MPQVITNMEIWVVARAGGAQRSGEQHSDSDGFLLAGGWALYLSAVRQTPGRDRK